MDVGPRTALRPPLDRRNARTIASSIAAKGRPSPTDPMQEQLRCVDVRLDGKVGVASTVEIAEKPLKDPGVGMALKPADHAWTEIDVEHDRLSLGEKETREPSELCGVRLLWKYCRAWEFRKISATGGPNSA